MNRTPPQAAKKTSRRGSPRVQMILRGGQKSENGFLALYWLSPQKPSLARKMIYLVVGKRALKFAHDRNRAKRLVREICREHFRKAGKSCPLVVRVVKEPGALTMTRFKNCLSPLLEKALA